MAVGIAVLATVGLLTPAAAHAAPSRPDGKVASKNRVQMTVACTVDSAKVRPGQSLADLCASAGGGIAPNDTVTGQCGDSFLYIWNLGNGIAAFEVGADSDLGPIAYGSATVSWANISTAYSTAYNLPVTANVGPANWFDWRDIYTGGGDIIASMGGDVMLTTGVVCHFLYPFDDEWITW
jgi:hypothetical protein